jgi:hypothetical protein
LMNKIRGRKLLALSLYTLVFFLFRLEEDQLDVTSIHVTVVEVTQNFKHSTKLSRYIKKVLQEIVDHW